MGRPSFYQLDQMAESFFGDMADAWRSGTQIGRTAGNSFLDWWHGRKPVPQEPPADPFIDHPNDTFDSGDDPFAGQQGDPFGDATDDPFAPRPVGPTSPPLQADDDAPWFSWPTPVHDPKLVRKKYNQGLESAPRDFYYMPKRLRRQLRYRHVAKRNGITMNLIKRQQAARIRKGGQP